MHRSRPLVLVIVAAAAAAACSKHDPSEGTDLLSQDRTLVARLEPSRDTQRPSVPDACGAITLAAAPSTANKQRADELTQQAGVAEMHGDIQDAQLLLRRAASLDGTNKSAAYHLGRTSEALGDRTTAMNAYCHYLALAPTANESVEARERVTALSRTTQHAVGSTNANAPARRSVAVTTPRRPVVEHSPVRPRYVASAPVASAPAQRSEPEPTTPPATVTQSSVTTSGEVASAPLPAPPVDQPPTAPRTQRRSTIGAQSAIIGVAAGAILGAATGRSVRSTVIGAAAGGVLGTVVGTATRPSGRSTRS
ncbi:MAG: hypothetical protein JF589_16880 [Gemmatimonadetes bacterium]|nr:hypothetical protein [Gemmatimonadota bacterium]